MTAPYNNIMRRLEDAFKGYVLTNDAPDSGTSLYTSMDQACVNDSMHLPCYLFRCLASRPVLADTMPEDVGLTTRTVTVTIEVRTFSEDDIDGDITIRTARESHDQALGRLIDLLTTSTLADEVTTFGDGVAVDQCDSYVEQFRVEGNAFVTELVFDVMARSVAT